MKAQEILNKIKEVVGIELAEEVSVKLEEMTLENGTVLVAEKFESGESIFIKTEDEQVALPVGEYDLPEGKKLIVKEEGLIDSVSDVEEVVEEEVEASTEEETELEEKEEEVAMEYVTKEEFTKAVDEIKSMIDEKMSKAELKEEVKEEVELSAEVAEPVVHNPEAKLDNNTWFNKSYPNTIQNRIYEKLNQ
jgi:hypothetical protein|tara:strand:- start:1250 stop:1825 length:576 start_codon:yes stop_codon:yes gene_type:complete